MNAARNGVWLRSSAATCCPTRCPRRRSGSQTCSCDLLERLLVRTDLPPVLLVSGLLERQTLGGSPRAVVDGWAAEVVRP